jgi:hypothetical protein
LYQLCWFAITFLVTGSFSTAFGAHTGIGTMPITLYGTEAKQKYVLLQVNGLEPTALLNQELDLMPTQEKQPFYPKTESIIRLPDKKCGSLMQVSVLCLSYLLVLEMIKYYWFHHRK